VGAIANEAGVESQYIQNIDINADFSTVDLPDGMPKEIENHLKGVRVMGEKLQLRKFTGENKSAKPSKKTSNKKTKQTKT
jgi:ATP-dependent RNA helicase DeaD